MTAKARRRGVLAGLAAMAAVAALNLPASQAAGLGSAYDVGKLGPQTLTVWWLGNQEIPGIEDWMSQSVKLYQTQHPNITVNTVLQSTDTYNTTQKTACKAGSGPDVWYNWGGTWSLELSWAGCTVANEDVFDASDLKPIPAIEGTRWGGKTWVYPIETRIYPIVYNKALFKQAGLDPEKPPTSWTDFIAAAGKLKAAGIDPIVTGLKDGFGGENLAVALQFQVFSVPDLIQQTINGDMTSPGWKSWIEKAVELKPYFNEDVNSILYADGLARFQDGKSAMVFASPGYLQMIVAMTKAGKAIGVMQVPAFGKPELASLMYEDTPGFQVTRFAKDPALAGNFLAFLHTPDRLNALYSMTGDLPNDTRWDTSQITRATDKQLMAWVAKGITYYSANYYPIDLDTNANFVVFQGILGGDMTADQAADTYQNVITKWRSVHKPDIANYQSWLKDYQK
jgi:raffinose/stachyose/melibiose transport system substrate-binding protein